jgi:hypothetical protein
MHAIVYACPAVSPNSQTTSQPQGRGSDRRMCQFNGRFAASMIHPSKKKKLKGMHWSGLGFPYQRQEDSVQVRADLQSAPGHNMRGAGQSPSSSRQGNSELSICGMEIGSGRRRQSRWDYIGRGIKEKFGTEPLWNVGFASLPSSEWVSTGYHYEQWFTCYNAIWPSNQH